MSHAVEERASVNLLCILTWAWLKERGQSASALSFHIPFTPARSGFHEVSALPKTMILN